MSLDISLTEIRRVGVYDANYTHNITEMADEAGVYEALWHPDRAGITEAAQLIPILESGISAMRGDPARFKKHNPENGWGSYDTFVPWLENLLAACQENTGASIEVSI